MKVLLLTHSGDFFTIDRVEKSLTALGLYPIRFNTDLYPSDNKLSISLHPYPQVILETETERVHFDEIQAVWTRRIWKPKLDNDIDSNFRDMSIRESSKVLKDSLALLDHAFWLDSIAHINRASNKILQLKTAQQHGLTTPLTLITNDDKKALDFYHQNTSVIAKMNTATHVSMEGSSLAMRTYKIEEEHLEDLDALAYCPMTFQEEIMKEVELRVVYVNGEFFTGAIDTSNTQSGKTDWRKSDIAEASWQNFKLPQVIQSKTSAFMQALNLQFGALDFIVTPNGEYVFLEVNPVGEWGMLEHDLKLPISKAIAKVIFNSLQNKKQS